MGNPKAFLEIHRQEAGYRPLHDRIHDFGEVEQTLNSKDRRTRAGFFMEKSRLSLILFQIPLSSPRFLCYNFFIIRYSLFIIR